MKTILALVIIIIYGFFGAWKIIELITPPLRRLLKINVGGNNE